MEHIGLWPVLCEEISTVAGFSKQHIIRFRHRRLFDQFMRLADRRGERFEYPEAFRPLPLIHAISCPLRSATKLKRFSQFISIEEDASIRLKHHSLLPAPSRHFAKSLDRNQKIPWGVRQIKAPPVWKRSFGQQVKIGVVDTGVDFSHPDLNIALGRGINLLNRLAPPFDDNGHGTHIIGTIAAANRSGGITGVAPRASIYPIKAFDHNGSAYVSDIIQAIDWCVANRMDIINMSFGMKHKSQSLLGAVQRAYRSGIIIVASSGNDGKTSTIDYPARYSQTISVGATTKSKQIASFSNRSRQIDVFAPGEHIYSTWLRGKYNELSGTSMATSHVTGAIALVLALKPGIGPAAMKRIIQRTTTPMGASFPSKGVVNALRMVRFMQRHSAVRAKRRRIRARQTPGRSRLR